MRNMRMYRFGPYRSSRPSTLRRGGKGACPTTVCVCIRQVSISGAHAQNHENRPTLGSCPRWPIPVTGPSGTPKSYFALGIHIHRKKKSAQMHRPSLFSNSHPLAFSSPAIAVLPSLRCCYKKQKLTTVHAEEPKVTREYREDDDSVVSASTSQPVEKNPNSKYIDEMPEVSNRALNACVASNL
jgi:hypothetical protein